MVEGIDGVVGVGEIVAGERENDLGQAGREDTLVAMDGVGVADVPEGFDERCKGGMGDVLKVKHASASGCGSSEGDGRGWRCWWCDCRTIEDGLIEDFEAMADEQVLGIGRVVGIDLGTTNSLVAFMEGATPVVIPGEHGERLVPSVVAWTDDGVVVGNAARGTLMADSASAVYSAKTADGARHRGCAGRAEALSVQAGGGVEAR